MKRQLAKYGWMLIALAIGGGPAGTMRVCKAQPPAIGSVVAPESKWGLGRLLGSFAPKPTPASTPQEPALAPDDPVSLSSRAEPSAHLYVAMARLHQDAGRLVEAEEQYRLALEHEPDHLDALLGYARLKERTGQPRAARDLYLRAAKAHPDQPVALNHLGLCLARQGQLEQAAAAVARAVQLRPNQALYRNNLATLLVDMGRLPEAFAHLRAVHSSAAAYYNLGYLLAKKGDQQAAAQHFRMALQLDPSLVQARQWLTTLGAEVSVAQRPATGGPSPVGPAAPSPADRRAGGPGPAFQPQTSRAGPQAHLNLQSAARPGPSGVSLPAENPAPLPPPVSSLRRLPPTHTTGPRQPFSGPTVPGPPAPGDLGPSAPLPPGYRR